MYSGSERETARWKTLTNPLSYSAWPAKMKRFFQKWDNPTSFCLFSSFSHYNFNNTKWKSVDGVLGIHTRGCWQNHWARQIHLFRATCRLRFQNFFISKPATFHSKNLCEYFIRRNACRQAFVSGQFKHRPDREDLHPNRSRAKVVERDPKVLLGLCRWRCREGVRC